MSNDRYGHHKDPWFKELCERAAGWLNAATSPSAIDTYSLEKIGQVKNLLPELREHVLNTTGQTDTRSSLVRLEQLAHNHGWRLVTHPALDLKRASIEIRIGAALITADGKTLERAADEAMAAINRIGRAS